MHGRFNRGYEASAFSDDRHAMSECEFDIAVGTLEVPKVRSEDGC